ncbi:MAG TPA: NFACT family protein [Pyrinomonadaceae bacterium]|nr:NFACT family protein [Pyrinomonadaceae bacterium]
MDQEAIQKIVEEIRPLLIGRYLGKIFQLAPLSFAIDFGLQGGQYLFISAEPSAPRLYLIKRRIKELEKQSSAHSPFAQVLRARLGGGVLLNVTRDPQDRVIRFSFSVQRELGETEAAVLVAQLTGRSANLFLLDQHDRITASLRTAKGSGQLIGTLYESPKTPTQAPVDDKPFPQGDFDSLSAALDSHYQSEELERSFQQRSKDLRSRLRKEIQQRVKLKENLESDLVVHGDAQEHKRLGDLLLANIATAERSGSRVLIRDFYSEGAPTIELELDENTSLQELATRYFARYAKAKRASEEIAARLSRISNEIFELLARAARLEEAIDKRDEKALAAFEKPIVEGRESRTKLRKAARIPGVRLYRSSDGFEILVGRGAGDNDRLTFRMAKPNDLWLHSADYPGSHVVVRKLNRKEIPHRTIVEAAQLAARFSQASKDSKVVVHYTPRKFLSKPRGAAPGLVRMSSFKTILVEPKESIQRI